MRPHARAEHGERERFEHVVVRPRLEPGEGVGVLDAGGEEHDGAAEPFAQPPARLEPVDAGHADVE